MQTHENSVDIKHLEILRGTNDSGQTPLFKDVFYLVEYFSNLNVYFRFEF